MFIGVRTVGDSKDIKPEQCSEMQDMEVSEDGSFNTRVGFLKTNTTSLGNAIIGLFAYKKRIVGSQDIIAINGTDAETVT